MKVAFSGSCGCGKTSAFNALKEKVDPKKYAFIEEQTRIVATDQGIGCIDEVKNVIAFENAIFKNYHHEYTHRDSPVCIFDTSIYEIYIYCKLRNPEDLLTTFLGLKVLHEEPFDKIFFFPKLPLSQEELNDGFRSPYIRDVVEDELLKLYKELGLKYIELPIEPLENRVQRILEEI